MKSMKTIYCIVLFAFATVTGCSQKPTPAAELINQQASLPGTLPYDPFQWRVITSGLNNKDAAMFTLYGNDAAVQYARANAAHAYPPGSVLCLVTWSRKEDKHWFGGEIPAEIRAIEFVKVNAAADGTPSTYQIFAGTPLEEKMVDATGIPDRINAILGMRASVMP